MKFLLVFFLNVIVFFSCLAQEKFAALNKKLKECSGIVKVEKNKFIMLNDGGNEPLLFVVNKKGEIINTCLIKNQKNRDWEDLCKDDKGNLYIADIGNNDNARTNLKILKIKIQTVLKEKKADAKSIKITYPNQKKFPPKKNKLYFDAEALVYHADKLWIFTKNRTDPFDGISYCYSVNLNTKKIKQETSLLLPATNWMEESVASATTYQNKLFILTYSKIYIYNINETKLAWTKTILLKNYNQWEAIEVDEKRIYLTNEKNPTSDAGFYYIKK